MRFMLLFLCDQRSPLLCIETGILVSPLLVLKRHRSGGRKNHFRYTIAVINGRCLDCFGKHVSVPSQDHYGRAVYYDILFWCLFFITLLRSRGFFLQTKLLGHV